MPAPEAAGLETRFRQCESLFDRVVFSALSMRAALGGCGAGMAQRHEGAGDAGNGATMLQALLHAPSGSGERFGQVATHKCLPTLQQVSRLLGFEQTWFEPDCAQAAQADLYYTWGIRTSIYRARLRWLAQRMHRPLFIVEDGLLLRSFGLGVGPSPELPLSVTLDAHTAYYDATRPSSLEQRLNQPGEFTPAERQRARAAIDEVRARRLSKYNHAPDSGEVFGQSNRRKVLLIDQRRNDASVRYGGASERTFDRMIRYAVEHRPDHQLLLKRHPDAISGGRSSYFSDKRLKRLPIPWQRTVLIDREVNPHTLFDQVDEVFVVTSGFGYEALMAGRPVHCFGTPFYGGWGLTTDHISVSRRDRQRDLVDLFHVASIQLARYFAPDLSGQVTLEDAIDTFTRKTGFRR